MSITRDFKRFKFDITGFSFKVPKKNNMIALLTKNLVQRKNSLLSLFMFMTN